MVNTINNDLLVTAQVHILDREQQPVSCRALLDTGATTNFMIEGLAKRLDTTRQECSIPVGALNSLTTMAKHTIAATIRSRISKYQRTLTFLVIPTIAQLIPEQPVDLSWIDVPKNLKLADPDFKTSTIDLLLGSGASLSLLSVGQINLSAPDGPDLFLQKTKVG